MNPEENEKKPPLQEVLKPNKSLRTYQGDVEDAISKNNYSSKDIFLAEQEKRVDGTSANPFIKPTVKNNLVMVLAFILLILGVVVIGFVYYMKSSEEIVVAQRTKQIISFSEEKAISIATTTREKFIGELVEEKVTLNLPVNSILYLNTVDGREEPAQTEAMLSLLAPRMPNSLARSFSNKYMLGVFSFDTNEPFILLKTDDYGLSFSGMLKWEKDAAIDLGRLFGFSQNASSSAAVFVDEERRNKDLRVLRDGQGKILLLYSFIDQETLLITKNENIFNAILSKYLISQQEK